MTKSIGSELISFGITLIAAFLGSYLAFRKYKKEKIWQEKYNAYQEILSSIFNIRYWAEETNSSCLGLPTISNTNAKEFHQRYIYARECISKQISIGKLIINNKVAIKLEEINQLLWEEDFTFENDTGIDDSNYREELDNHTTKIQRIIDERLEEIITLSKRDLK